MKSNFLKAKLLGPSLSVSLAVAAGAAFLGLMGTMSDGPTVAPAGVVAAVETSDSDAPKRTGERITQVTQEESDATTRAS